MDRVAFSVTAVSSEDPEYTAAELPNAGTHTKGWQSARNCGFPQELILRLISPSKLQQIQLLSHEFKIASKLELFVCPSYTDSVRTFWRRLGSLTFDKNERGNFQARELKSIHVSTEAEALRLLLHEPHSNPHNIHSQVGLVAVNLYGREGSLPLTGQQQWNEAQPHSNGLSSSERNSTPEVDSLTAQKIMELKSRKDAAVAREDYDEAKALKLEVDRLRALGSRILELETRKQLAVEEEDYDTAKAIKAEIVKIRASGLAAPVEEIAVRAGPPLPGALQYPLASPDEAVIGHGSEQHGSAAGAEPERQAVVRGRATAEAALDAVVEDHGSTDLGGAPSDWPTGLPQPEPLSPADTKDADDIGRMLGPFVAAALYSKTWQLREAALQQLDGFILRQDPSGSLRDILPAATRAIQRAVKERVPNVFQAGLQVLARIVEACAKGPAARDAASLVSDVLPTLLEKVGDSNARIQGSANDAILRLAKIQESGLPALAPAFVAAQRQAAWRPLLARLQLLSSLVPIWGVSAGPGGEGIPLEAMMKFVNRAFGNANADVRSSAVGLTILVHKAAGAAAVEKLLPRDLNPKIREQIEAGVRGSPPPVPASATSGRLSEGSAAKSDRRRSSGSSGRQKPAVKEAAPAVAAARVSPPATSRVNVEELEASTSREDPTPYQLELASREQILGPDHPEVAVSLSNLAILHNQRGEFAEAQPLYERALAIFEMHFGPYDANVAHTLTDLAVLHLEQGNVDAGRPLLERALVIQEQALGPDHPDVIAIRDVLDDKEE